MFSNYVSMVVNYLNLIASWDRNDSNFTNFVTVTLPYIPFADLTKGIRVEKFKGNTNYFLLFPGISLCWGSFLPEHFVLYYLFTSFHVFPVLPTVTYFFVFFTQLHLRADENSALYKLKYNTPRNLITHSVYPAD